MLTFATGYNRKREFILTNRYFTPIEMPIFIRKTVEGRTDEEEASFQNFFLHLLRLNL